MAGVLLPAAGRCQSRPRAEDCQARPADSRFRRARCRYGRNRRALDFFSDSASPMASSSLAPAVTGVGLVSFEQLLFLVCKFRLQLFRSFAAAISGLHRYPDELKQKVGAGEILVVFLGDCTGGTARRPWAMPPMPPPPVLAITPAIPRHFAADLSRLVVGLVCSFHPYPPMLPIIAPSPSASPPSRPPCRLLVRHHRLRPREEPLGRARARCCSPDYCSGFPSRWSIPDLCRARQLRCGRPRSGGARGHCDW